MRILVQPAALHMARQILKRPYVKIANTVMRGLLAVRSTYLCLAHFQAYPQLRSKDNTSHPTQ